MKKVLFIPLIVIIAFQSKAQSNLYQQFKVPSHSARPRVWWHWMNGNISKDGIQKDLDWMEKTGIGGFQNFDANLFTPLVVPKKLVFMQDDWKEAFRFTTELAHKKGLEMAIAGSPGWSVTGGPWVKPEDAMKKYVWTESTVIGGNNVKLKLPKPSGVIGKFQDAIIKSDPFSGGFVGEQPIFYKDVMVLAFPKPKEEKYLMDLKPQLIVSGGAFNLEELTDGKISKSSFLPPMKVDEDMFIQYSFEDAQTFKAVSVSGAVESRLADFDGTPLNRSLKVSDDGINFTEICKFSGSNVPYNTYAFPSTKAKYWRLCFKTLPPQMNIIAAMTGGNPFNEKSDGVNVAEFTLHTTAKIDQVEDKAGFSPWKENSVSFIPDDYKGIPSNSVLNLSQFLDAEGNLNWNAPAGVYTILRFGYSLTGRQNHPASPEATGLEVDKLDAEAVKRYINKYLDMYKDATGGLMGKAGGLQYMVLDSYEAGHMTWTANMLSEFKKRRNYDMITYIPVLTGRIVNDVSSSEKFLWDFRKTIGEMIVENHYEVIGQELHKRGMKRYTESHEDRRIYLADGMHVKAKADIPMAAMWMPGSLAAGPNEEIRSEADIREAASVANIYGQNIVAAESMTSINKAFSFHPAVLKRTADLEMASGLNRFVIHTSVHQALDDKKPGFSLGPFGQYFTRHETWSGAGAKAWISYLTKSCELLQKGRNVAKILYLYGENTNITWQFKSGLPYFEGQEYDFCSSSTLFEAIQAQNKKLIAISGNTYSAMVLDSSTEKMTLGLLKKIGALALAGVKIYGAKPLSSPSLTDDNAEFEKLANKIWSMASVSTEISKVKTDLQPDVLVKKAMAPVLFRHRKTRLEDIYWFNSRSAEANSAKVIINISEKKPELWDPQTGDKKTISYKMVNGGIELDLKFEPWQAYFVIFSENTSMKEFIKPSSVVKNESTINANWSIYFEDNGKTQEIETAKLYSWTESNNNSIKYYSGTAIYKSNFSKSIILGNLKYEIDLGNVENIAEVVLNGKNVGTVWKKPYKLDISEAIVPGNNSLEIKVTNTWVNRLIGDAQKETKEKYTFTTMPFYRGKEELLPAGLLGPIKILEIKE
jgi:hypothetical protein